MNGLIDRASARASATLTPARHLCGGGHWPQHFAQYRMASGVRVHRIQQRQQQQKVRAAHLRPTLQGHMHARACAHLCCGYYTNRPHRVAHAQGGSLFWPHTHTPSKWYSLQMVSFSVAFGTLHRTFSGPVRPGPRCTSHTIYHRRYAPAKSGLVPVPGRSEFAHQALA